MNYLISIMNKKIVLLFVVISILCFLSVILFTLPSLSEALNLTTKANIGNAIGGITAPVIGIITSILLYLALSKQTESNIDQRIKNESDVIFLLLNQVSTEINMIYYKVEKKRGDFRQEYIYTGTVALNEFSREFSNYDLKNEKITFKCFYEANQLKLIISSLKLIDKRINISILSDDLKQLFVQKAELLYECMLKDPLENIIEYMNKHPHLKDEVAIEIENFIASKRHVSSAT